MVTQRRHFPRACSWMTRNHVDALKNLRSVQKFSFWPSKVALPSILAPCSGVVCSFCLGVWFAELAVNGLPVLDSSCDLDDSVVGRSIFRSESTLPAWGSLVVCQWPGALEMQRRKQNSLRFWRFVRILPDEFSWDDFWQTFQCATNFWTCFSWSVRQKLSDKVRLQKVKPFLFLIKDPPVGLLFFLNFVLLAVASQRDNKFKPAPVRWAFSERESKLTAARQQLVQCEVFLSKDFLSSTFWARKLPFCVLCLKKLQSRPFTSKIHNQTTQRYQFSHR